LEPNIAVGLLRRFCFSASPWCRRRPWDTLSPGQRDRVSVQESPEGFHVYQPLTCPHPGVPRYRPRCTDGRVAQSAAWTWEWVHLARRRIRVGLPHPYPRLSWRRGTRSSWLDRRARPTSAAQTLEVVRGMLGEGIALFVLSGLIGFYVPWVIKSPA
jgi:hypothetical protein